MSNESFPFMGALSGEWKGIPMRLFRLSFSGEPAYEIAAPTDQGDALVRALAALGRQYGCTPYGLEALGSLRIQQGQLAGGDLNGQVTAPDLGRGRRLPKANNYVGRALHTTPAPHDPAPPPPPRPP